MQSTEPETGVLRSRLAPLGFAIALATFSLTAFAKPPAADPAQGKTRQPIQPEWLNGAVEGFNLSPRGEVESLMLGQTTGLVQVVLPPEIAATVVEAVPMKDRITVAAVPDKGVAGHPVYKLVSLTTRIGRQLAVDPAARKPKIPRPDNRAAERAVRVDVTVRQINYGKRGEANGALVERGDFVFLGAEGAGLLKLAVGQRLSVEGVARPMPRNRMVIEATVVNGMAIPKKPAPPPGGPKGGKPQKTPLAPEQVPSAVMETLRQQAGGMDFSKLEVEMKADQAIYSAKWMAGDSEHEAKVTAGGSLIEAKNVIPAQSLPDAVRNAVYQTYPDNPDLECKEKTTYSAEGAVTIYEIKLHADGRKTPPIKVRPDGTVEEHGATPKAPKPQ
jgi:hypothetical protein